MKMKMYQAPTEKEALALVHAEMGPDAVILSTRDEGGNVEIRAAIERNFDHQFAAPSASRVRPIFEPRPEPQALQTTEHLAEALTWHGAPQGFTDIVSSAGGRLGAGLEPQTALTAGIEGVLTFAPLQQDTKKSILLIGAPGSGKTTVTAKLARMFGRGDSPIEAFSADLDVNGQSARLACLTQRPVVAAAYTPESLLRMVREADEEGRRLVIDGPSCNPIDETDIIRHKALISCMNVEPVLVMSAEGHPMDLEDNARVFGQFGIRRVILTKLDTVRRRAGAIAAISSARLSIAQLGMGPTVRSGLAPASASEVARLLLVGEPETELLKGAA